MSGWFGSGFSANKAKPQLKMATTRIQLITNKETQLIKRQKKEIAKLLAEGKEEKARIRTEHVVRQDFKLEALDVLGLLCELLFERMNLIISMKACPTDLREAVSTLIWAAPRTQVQELLAIKKLFSAKYGKNFTQNAVSNADGIVNERIVHKLGVQPPNAFLVLQYMREIAKSNGIDWQPADTDVDLSKPLGTPDGSSVKTGGASGMEGVYAPKAAAVVTTGDTVKCGSCLALLAVPANVARFACSNCSALLHAPNNGTQVVSAQPYVPPDAGAPGVSFPMPPSSGAEFKNNGGGGKGGGDGSGGGDIALPMPPATLPGAGATFVNDDKSPATGGGDFGAKYDATALPSVPPTNPTGSLSNGGRGGGDGGGGVPDFDELAARFKNLQDL